MSRSRYLRTRHPIPWGTEPGLAPEFVPRTENEETRRAARDWLRERDEENVIEFDEPELGY